MCTGSYIELAQINYNELPYFTRFNADQSGSVFVVYSRMIEDKKAYSFNMSLYYYGSLLNSTKFILNVTATDWNYYAPTFIDKLVEQIILIGSLQYYVLPLTHDGDGDFVVITLYNSEQNNAELPYFASLENKVVIFAPHSKSDVGKYKLFVNLTDNNHYPFTRQTQYDLYVTVKEPPILQSDENKGDEELIMDDPKNVKNKTTFKIEELQAKILSITKYGVMEIIFDRAISPPKQFYSWNSEHLIITLVNSRTDLR